MKSRGVIGFAAGAIAILVWTACVGDDPGVATTPAGQGAQNQPCFANETCLVGLTCTSNVCVVANAADASSGGTSTSSSSSSSSSSSTGGLTSASSSSSGESPTDCGALGDSSDGVTCPLQKVGGNDPVCTGTTTVCCPGLGCQAPTTKTCAAKYNGIELAPFACFSDLNCSTGSQCCGNGVFGSSDNTCMPYVVTFQNANTCKVGGCDASDYHFCVPNNGDRSTCNETETCAAASFDVTGADGIPYRKALGICITTH